MKSKQMTHAALLAAAYIVLTQLQNLLLPGSAVQFRVTEALCVIALFTPSAVWGLTVGCLLFNLTLVGALPLDIVIGSVATLLSAGGMYLTRNIKIFGFPLLAMCLPAVCNGLLVGWELTLYLGGGFWLNVLYVALGELAVLLTLGSLLYSGIRRRKLKFV